MYNELFERVYQGTAFKFDHPSLDYINKGQGSQSFGWGLYFTSSEDIAEWYAHDTYRSQKARGNTDPSLSSITYKIFNTEKPVRVTKKSLESKDPVKRFIAKKLFHISAFVLKVYDIDDTNSISEAFSDFLQVDRVPSKDDIITDDQLIKANRYLKSIDPYSIRLKSKSSDLQPYIYKFDINDDILPYLAKWDYSIKKQTDEVKKCLYNFTEWDDPNSSYSSDMTYEQFYRELADESSQKEASLALLESGILGASYAAGQLHGNGRGATNYVLYTDDPAKIKKIRRQGYAYNPDYDD